jgi:hypothetical protein
MNKELIDLLRTEFFERLETKTGWGKEQIKKEFEQSVNSVVLYLLDKKGE